MKLSGVEKLVRALCDASELHGVPGHIHLYAFMISKQANGYCQLIPSLNIIQSPSGTGVNLAEVSANFVELLFLEIRCFFTQHLSHILVSGYI